MADDPIHQLECPQASPDDGLRLSAALREVLAHKPPEGITLGYIVEITGERAYGVLMAFLCLPFLVPLLPGMSTPFGLLIMLLGIQLAIGWHRPWMPARLRRWRLPDKLTTKVLAAVAKIFNPLEKLVRPRLAFMQNRVAYVFVGAGLALDGLLLALPLPLPGSNVVPAWMALILILGLTEEDGIIMLLGLAITGGAVAALPIAVMLGAKVWG